MTDVEKVRVLIGDSAAPQTFTDAELQLFLDLSGGSLYLASALACDRQATSAASSAQSFAIGSYSVTGGSNTVTAFAAQAKAFRDLEYNTPAFAVVEENLTDHNALLIIRNQILRTGE